MHQVLSSIRTISFESMVIGKRCMVLGFCFLIFYTLSISFNGIEAKYQDGKNTSGSWREGHRSVFQLGHMIHCQSGCDPTLYRRYGCFCGYKGSGRPVDPIDNCCLNHDWCYTRLGCPPFMLYVLRYNWICMRPGHARCNVIKNIQDPEKPQTLEELEIVNESDISINVVPGYTPVINIYITPTVPHCSLATLIGLCIRVKFEKYWGKQYKMCIFIKEGTHSSVEAINKQLNDKERIAAALENSNLKAIVDRCIKDDFLDD